MNIIYRIYIYLSVVYNLNIPFILCRTAANII